MTTEPLFILMADDDSDDRYLFEEAISELSINAVVHTVDDGVQLMERLNKTPLQLPGIIFLDLNMPRKNGLQCLREIRASQALKDIPVVIYSTSDSEKDLDDTFASGADVYITKPHEFEVLKKVLKKAVMKEYGSQPRRRDNYFLRK